MPVIGREFQTSSTATARCRCPPELGREDGRYGQSCSEPLETLGIRPGKLYGHQSEMLQAEMLQAAMPHQLCSEARSLFFICSRSMDKGGFGIEW